MLIFKRFMAYYHERATRSHYRMGRMSLCLFHLQKAEYWDISRAESPKHCAYLAICHYRLKDWDRITFEVERALFKLRRYIQEDKEAFILWQELKSQLTELQKINRYQHKVFRTGHGA